MDPMPEIPSVLQRLESLERQVRRSRAVTWAALVVAAAVVFLGRSAPSHADAKASKTLEVEKLVLKSANGKVAALLRTSDQGPHFELFDSTGLKRVALFATKKGSFAAINDAKGTNRVLLGSVPAESVVLVNDADGKSRSVIGVRVIDNQEVPIVQLKDEKENPRLVAQVTQKEADFMVADAKGSARVTMGMTRGDENNPLGTPFVFLRDETRKLRTALVASNNVQGVEIYDEAGKQRVSLSQQEGGPRLLLFDGEAVKPRVGLLASKSEPRLAIQNDKGFPVILLEQEKAGPQIWLRSGDGATLFRQPPAKKESSD